MCKPDFNKFKDVNSKAEIEKINVKGQQAIDSTHTHEDRDTRFDLLWFLGPALFYNVTNIVPIYATAIARIISADVILSLHFILVDKDNYLNKLSQKQLKREKEDYRVSFVLHMWAQVALQLLFPSMFFSENSEVWVCAKEALIAHILIVEPLYYFVHRWLHIPKQMKAMHGFHHLSVKPTPLTALVQNFHEHFVYIATFGPAFFLPFILTGRQHWAVIGAYLVLFDMVNAYGHTNIRIRNWFFTSPYSPLTYLFYTPEFHLGHHAYFRANYGLFMPFWDRILGTYKEYRLKDKEQLLPYDKQDFVFIGHCAGLSHLLTLPEISLYNVYDDVAGISFLPLKLEMFIMHLIGIVWRMILPSYKSSRYCIANEYIGRIISIARTPWDYMSPKSYDSVNKDMVELIRKEYKASGTRYFGLGNLNKMKQLNDGGVVLSKMINEDPYLKDKNIRIWTGDTSTAASVYHQIVDIPNLKEFFYIGASGKIGTAVIGLLIKNRPDVKICIYSRYQMFNHPNVKYTTDLKEMQNYKVVIAGKILPINSYRKAMAGNAPCKTRYVLDYTVPFLPITAALKQRKENIQHIRIGLVGTTSKNAFLKGHYDINMGHGENLIVPCHFGCILHTVNQRETNEVGEIDPNEIEKTWKQTVARGFNNVVIKYDE